MYKSILVGFFVIIMVRVCAEATIFVEPRFETQRFEDGRVLLAVVECYFPTVRYDGEYLNHRAIPLEGLIFSVNKGSYETWSIDFTRGMIEHGLDPGWNDHIQNWVDPYLCKFKGAYSEWEVSPNTNP